MSEKLIVGRKREISLLNRFIDSDEAEFVAVYGRRRVGKTYLVKTAGRWSEDKLALLRSPITLDDGYTIRPVPVEVVKLNADNTQLLRFVLTEGRKRQIRKMCSAAHLVVLSLKRISVGAFELPADLAPGKWRDLSSDEIAALFR